MATPIEQLEAMRQVPENWDGYGGAAPRPELIDAAIHFLRTSRGTSALPEPYVTPTRVGGVLISWESGPHQLEVEFDSAEKGTFVYLNQDTGESATGTLMLTRSNGRSPVALTAIMSAIPVLATP